MQQAIPYRRARAWAPPPCAVRGGGSAADNGPATGVEIARAVVENPVVVVGRRGCCMLHVVRRLLQGQGVSPAVCEVGDDADESALAEEIAGCWYGGAHDRVLQLPAVFIGGRLAGGLEQIMAVHLSGELVPVLKEAGALWLSLS